MNLEMTTGLSGETRAACIRYCASELSVLAMFIAEPKAV